MSNHTRKSFEHWGPAACRREGLKANKLARVEFEGLSHERRNKLVLGCCGIVFFELWVI